MINCERLSQQPSKNERAQEPMSRSLQLCHGIFTDWSIFGTPLLLWKKGSSGPVTQWRQLVSCDWLWQSHGGLIQSRFDLKINRSMKTPWQEYSWVTCSYSLGPDEREIKEPQEHATYWSTAGQYWPSDYKGSMNNAELTSSFVLGLTCNFI